MKTTGLIVAVFLVLFVAANPAASQCGDAAGSWSYGPTKAAHGNGSIAVYNSGRMLQVARIVDPSNPTPIASLEMPGIAESVVVDGSWAYVAAYDGGVVVVDISTPAHPEIAATVETEGEIRGVTLVGNLLYAVDGFEGLIILDVADPAAPMRRSTLDLDGFFQDTAVHGTLAFVADYGNGLRVIDVADPSNPLLVASIEDLDHSSRVAITDDGSTLYLSHYFDGFHVIDVTDHLAPEIIGFVEYNDYTLDLETDGGFLYVANRTYGMKVFDLADPQAPVEVRRVDPGGDCQSATVFGDMAFLGNFGAGLRLVDISNPPEAEEIGFIDGIPESKGVSVQGGLAYVSGGPSQVILDLARPDEPEMVSVSDFDGYVRRAVVDGSYVYAAGDRTGIRVIDIDDPEQPEEIGFVEACDTYDVVKDGDLLYVSCYDEGIRVVDVSTPADPVVIGSIDGFRVGFLNHSSGVIYGPEYNNGVRLVDVTDPTEPVALGLMDITRPIGRPEIEGDLLFIADSTAGVGIFDNTDPRNPVELSWIGHARYGFGMATTPELLFVATIYGGAYIFDVTNPSAPVELANPPLATSAEAEVASEGNLVLVAERTGGVEIFDLGACSSTAATADFLWRPADPEVGQSVRLTDISMGSVETREWDFDDGSGSSQRNPDHLWTDPGDYEVRLTVGGPYGTASVTKTVTVEPRTGPPPIFNPGEHVYVIAASSHAQGLADTRWVTDMVLHNPGSEAAVTYLWFMKAGQSNLGAEAQPMAVAAGGALLIEDAVLTLFDENDASGALLIGSDQPLLVTSRTYNDAASGTYGQFIAGRDLEEAVETGESVRLIQLTRTTDFRTNLGVANPSSTAIVVDVSLQDAEGTVVNSRTLNVPAFGFFQKTDVFGTDVDDGVAVVSSATSEAVFFPYASVVDNRTGDPMFVEPITPDRSVIIAAAAHVGGLADTDWRTDLEICSFNPDALQVTLELLESDQNNSSPDSVDVALDENSCRRLTDVLETSFGFEGSAALNLHSAEGDLTVSSRTFNTTDSGTYGQFLPGQAPGAVIEDHREARIIQLQQSQENDSGFRTNLGLVNRESIPTTVDVELRAATGTSLGNINVVLLPYEHRQINRVFRQVTSGEVSNGFAVVSTSTVGGSFVAYASVVDNASGDPIYIPATVVGD